MNLTRIISIVLFAVALGLAFFLYNSINSTIEFQNSISTTEKQLTDKLEVIREAEKVFLEQKGHYTANFDSLINFIETGTVPVTVRTETIIPLSYGVDSVQVKIDTIAIVPAKEKIFKKNYAVNASEDGTFQNYYVKVGDYVVKGSKSYRMRPTASGKLLEYTFLDKGTISSIADLKPGDAVTKGQNLINFWDYHLNPNVDIKTLGIVPGSGKPFDIYVGKLDKSGVKVSVIEVKDPAPINPERKATNEAKNRQPLGFGSRVDVGTTGNWE
jgi:hypothetical protein